MNTALPLVTIEDLRHLGARLARGQKAPSQLAVQDDLPTMQMEPRKPDPVDEAIAAIDLATAGATSIRLGRKKRRAQSAKPSTPTANAKPATKKKAAAAKPTKKKPPPTQKQATAKRPTKPPPTPKKDDGLNDLVSEIISEARLANAREKKAPSTQTPWHDDFFDEVFLTTYPEPGERQIARRSEHVSRLLKLPDAVHLVEIGAGSGWDAVALARAGYGMTAIERSADAASTIRRRANGEGVPVEVIEADVRDLESLPSCHAVLCLGSTFGLYREADNQAFAAQLVTLSQGRRILIEVLNRDYLVPRLPHRGLHQLQQLVVAESAQFNCQTSTLTVDRQVVWPDSNVDQRQITIRLYSAHELVSLFINAGARRCQVYGPPAFRGFFLPEICPSTWMVVDCA